MNNKNTQLLEVLPKELKFIFELKKQSSCSVRLTNITNQHVAFKVKTTSPKKYCVRPNVGVIVPKSTFEFTVTMQAQKVAPTDLICKDKFLIQGTIVSFGITEKDITAEMFARDDSKYIEEIKMRVALISPPQSPVLSPINGKLNQGIYPEPQVQEDQFFRRINVPTQSNTVPVDAEIEMSNGEEFNVVKNKVKPTKTGVRDLEVNTVKNEVKPVKTDVKDHEINAVKNEVKPMKTEVDYEVNVLKEDVKPINSDVIEEDFSPVEKETLKPKKVDEEELHTATKEELGPRSIDVGDQLSKPAIVAEGKLNSDVLDSKDIKPPRNEHLMPVKDSVDEKLAEPVKGEDLLPVKDLEIKKVKAVDELKLVSDIEELKTKLNLLESKVSEAESTISKLIEEKRLSTEDRKRLQEELMILRNRTGVKRVQTGFPLLYVVTVALISIVIGYLSR